MIDEYKALADNDPAGAFRLMKRASELAEVYETERHESIQKMNDQKTYAEYMEAKKALELGKSASDGKIKATADNDVVKEWEYYNKYVMISGIADTKLNMLKRVYFDCKDIWSKGEANVRRTN